MKIFQVISKTFLNYKFRNWNRVTKTSKKGLFNIIKCDLLTNNKVSVGAAT